MGLLGGEKERLNERGGGMSVLDMVKTRQEKWKARMEGMSRERSTRKIFEGEMEGKIPRGRPRMRWTDNFK